MGTQVSVGSEEAECEISIGPFRLQQDHEKMNVNVKSLVSIFEHEDGGTGECCGAEAEGGCLHDAHGVVHKTKQLPDIVQCSAQFPASGATPAATTADHLCRRPEKVIDDEDPPVTLLAVKRKDSKSKRGGKNEASVVGKDTIGVLPDRPHFMKNNIVAKYVVKEKIGHDLRRCYSDSWGTYGLTDDTALLEALKDVIDKPQAISKGGKGEKKSKRIRLPKKPPAPAKPFQEQVKDIFNPDKAQHSPGTSSCESEDDSEESCVKRRAKPPISSSVVGKCKGSCQGNYNVLRAAGRYAGSGACRVCHCEGAEERGAGVTLQKPKTDKGKKRQPTTDVVNIVLVETQQHQWPPPSVNLQGKPPKVSKRRKATVERKVFEWQFGNNKHLTRTFAPVVSELGNVLGGKSLTEEETKAADQEVESVSSQETDYEYALTDVTDGWKVLSVELQHGTWE